MRELEVFALGHDGRTLAINDATELGGDRHLLTQAFALSLGDTGKVPTEIQLGYAASFQGHPRPFALTKQVFDDFIKNKQDDPPVDREHESILNDFDVAGAQGWIKGLKYRDVGAGATPGEPVLGLFGDVDWTDLGEENVAKKRFRYLSMGFTLKTKDRKSNESIGAALDHVALVKKPFIQGMQALSLSAANFPGRGRADGGDVMEQLKKYLIGVLGLKADATEEEIVNALKAHEGPVKLSLSTKGQNIVALSAEAAAALGGAADVSKAIVELSAKAGSATELEKDVKALKADKVARTVEALIEAKKATPAEREELIELATKEPALFERLASKREPIAALAAGSPRLVTKPSGQTKAEAQKKAIGEYQAKNPSASYGDALRACAAVNPELFKEEV